MSEKIIECNICGVGNDVMYVNPKTELCNACSTVEDEVIVVHVIRKPDDIIKVHKTLEDIFGE